MNEKVTVLYTGAIYELICPEYGLTMRRGEAFECDRSVYEALKAGPNGDDYKLSGPKQPEKKTEVKHGS